MPVGTSSVTGRGRPGILRRLTDASDSKRHAPLGSREPAIPEADLPHGLRLEVGYESTSKTRSQE